MSSESLCLVDGGTTEWRLEFLTEHGLKLCSLAVSVSKLQCCMIIIIDCDDKFHVRVIADSIHADCNRQAGTIKNCVAQASSYLILKIKMESLHYFSHKSRLLESDNLILE